MTRRETQRKTSKAIALTEFYYSDSPDVDGVKIPFKTTQTVGKTTYVFSLDDVRHNVPIDEATFKHP